jgi:uncharacterized protein (TIGR03437 family)
MRTNSYLNALAILLVGFIFLSITSSPAEAQQVSLSLGSGSSVPGSSVSLDLSLTTSASAQPAVFQWTMNYPAADIASVSIIDGPTATAASKSILCSSTPGVTVCVAYGVNQNVISDGVAATVTFNIASGALDTSAAVQVTGVAASAPDASEIATSGTGGTISISQTSQPPVASSLSCIPASVTAPGTSACTVTLTAPAQTGGLSVTLANNNSNVSTPTSLAVPAGSSSTGLTATVAAVTTAQSASLTASAGGVTKTFSLGIAPPLWSISGTISPSSSGSGTTVTLSGAASAVVTADASGNYTFSGLSNGTYTITPSKTGYAFGPTSQSVTINGASLTGINFTDPALPPAANAISVDATVWQDQSTAASNVTVSGLSTMSGNELLLAFISTDATGPSTTVTNLSGAGLTWELAVRTNVQAGTSEIWRAFASTPLSNVSITATLSQTVASSMTVMSFSGVDTSGSNGSGAIGTIGSGYAAPGAPTATLTTTRDNSWVFGVGNDYDTATPRTLGTGQSMVHQDLPNISGVAVDAFWFQMQTNPTPASGTSVTINDTAPASDQYNLSIIEVLPALPPSTQTWTLSGSLGSSGSAAKLTLSGAASATATADVSGNYTFGGLANGTYTMTPSKSGYIFSPTSQTVTVSSANLSAINFTATAQTWSLSGTISPSSTASGATVKLGGASSATVTANSSGVYTFTGLVNGTYTVTPSKTGYSFSPASQSLTLSGANLSALNFTATAQTWNLSGTISPSSASSGASVKLGGASSATVTANSSGVYTFNGLVNGTYTVTPSKSGYTFSPTSQTVTVSSASLTAINFTAQSVSQTWAVSGTISPSSVGSGAIVTLSGAASATATADASGNYAFTGLGNGTYTVTPSKSGCAFSPANQSVTINSANLSGINFAANVQTATLAIDAKAFRNNSSGSYKVVSPKFSTTAGSELLLAFISADYAGGTNTTVTSVSGAGLTWALAVRTNIQSGTSEIWRAFTPVQLSSVAVTARLSQSVPSSMTVMTFRDVDTSGSNGSGAIGATSSGQAPSGAPTASLITTRNNSWTFGVGNDFDNALGRTPGSNQSLVHQALPNTSGVAVDTFWVQMENNPTPLSGTSVRINDTAPTTDRYNLSIVEVLPALTTPAANAPAVTAGEMLASNLTMSNSGSDLKGEVCSPGGLANLSGSRLTTQAPETARSIPLPTRLADLQVDVNGVPAPLLFVSDSRVTFQCPLLAPGSPLEVTLRTENGRSISRVRSLMQAAMPGLFTWGTAGQGVVMNAATNEIAMPKTMGIASRPAVPGEYLTIYATGLGEVSEPLDSGALAPVDRLVLVKNRVSVVIGGVEIDPSFAGLAPGTAGLFQVNAQLPRYVPIGQAVPLYLKVILSDGNTISSNTVTVAIE